MWLSKLTCNQGGGKKEETRWEGEKKGEREEDWKERIRFYTNVRGTNEPNDDYPQFPSVDDGGMDEKKRQPLSGGERKLNGVR